MNKLSPERRVQVVAALVEGNSIRATVRMIGIAKNTVVKLLVDLGRACDEYQRGLWSTSAATASSAMKSGPSSTRRKRT